MAKKKKRLWDNTKDVDAVVATLDGLAIGNALQVLDSAKAKLYDYANVVVPTRLRKSS